MISSGSNGSSRGSAGMGLSTSTGGTGGGATIAWSRVERACPPPTRRST
jgi:hypothetical protein